MFFHKSNKEEALLQVFPLRGFLPRSLDRKDCVLVHLYDPLSVDLCIFKLEKENPKFVFKFIYYFQYLYLLQCTCGLAIILLWEY